MTTSLAETPEAAQPDCIPTPIRIGLLGLGTVGSAVARLTRSEAPRLHARGISPVVTAALVRDASATRPAAPLVAAITADPDAFFRSPIDVVIEALGGVEPARTLVTRALDRGIPVVTANKSLVAAHGDALATLARQRGTAFRYEASCVAGVPFLGTFERRPLASRCSGVTGILNGTSNVILTALAGGATFEAALADAQRRGFAEPDPAADISGADAAQKLAILTRLFGARLIDPGAIPAVPLSAVTLDDVRAASAFGGTIKPVARATWTADRVEAVVAPSFLPASHPLATVSHVTNAVVLDTAGGPQCFIGPGAGPDVTAATLMDDVVEVATERTVRAPAPLATRAAEVVQPQTRWFIRSGGHGPDAEVVDLLASFGIWCERFSHVAGARYALTMPASADRAHAAAAALQNGTGAAVVCLPALDREGTC